MVTTARLTHATPASLYAHSADRDWEADANLASQADPSQCNRDIAAQLVYSDIGRKIKVRNLLRTKKSVQFNVGNFLLLVVVNKNRIFFSSRSLLVVAVVISY